MLGFFMQRIDERSLVAATKPELVLLDTPELNAETPAHLLDDDITPIGSIVRAQHRRDAGARTRPKSPAGRSASTAWCGRRAPGPSLN